MQILGGSSLNMNLSLGWTAGQNSQINMFGNAGSVTPGRITGGDFQLEGELNVLTSFFGSGSQRIESDTTIATTALVNVGDGNQLEFHNTTIDGGSFTVGENASLDFSGDVEINGGDFQTHSNLSSQGAVLLTGATEYSGAININGVARQVGNATVSGPSLINASVFDMDGNGGTNWQINHNLAINADSIDSTISNVFDGVIDVSGGIFPHLQINLNQPDGQWTMAGQLSLSNNLPAVANRISGSHMQVTGDVLVNDALIRILSDTTFASSSTVTFDNQNSSLILAGDDRVQAGALFLGQGTLINGVDSEIVLASGVSMDDVSLLNQGLLMIGDSPGIADVGAFENAATATWLVEIGGHLAGVEFDSMIVGGGDANLDGLIDVSLIDAGGGLFLPETGDEFTILTSLGGVFGEFLNSPISILNDGTLYQWEVLYHPNDVTLRVASISSVPEPTGACYGLLVLVGLARWRRRPGSNAE